ncbi:MAG: calcium-binding protein, partial [Pseudomonadota bacterium]
NGTVTLQEDGTLVSLVAATTANDGDDTITLGSGDLDALLGGGADTLSALVGNSNLIGDGGELRYYGSGLLDTATADSLGGGDDSVSLGSGTGNSVLLGGVGADSLLMADGDHVISGDNAFVHLDTDGALLRGVSLDVLGDSDTLTTGTGTNIILGGVGADTITTGDGDDIVIGDNGEVLFTGTTGNLVRELITTQDTGTGGDDVIVLGDGDKTVLAGTGGDSVRAGDGVHDVFGDNGEIVYSNGIAVSLATTDGSDVGASSGGSDTVVVGTGDGRLLGGLGNDQLSAGDGVDVILGDLGHITLDAAGLLLEIESLPTLQGGDDVIASGNGRGWIIGGVGGDIITTGSAADGVFGDNGVMTFIGGILQVASSTDTTADTTGADSIDTGAGDDWVIAGFGGDSVASGAGNDLVLADGGQVDYVSRDGIAASIDLVESGDPMLGGADTVRAGDGSDVVIGGAGADFLEGGSGNDFVIGDGGLVLFTAGRMQQMQTLDPYTGGGDDWIDGGAGQDILFGGEGNDTFVANFLEDAVIGDYARFTAESKTMIRFGNDLIGTSQLGVYASSDPFLKETASLGGRGYNPMIVSESLLARLVRENAEADGHRVSGMTEEVELAGVRDVEVDPATLQDAFVEMAPPMPGGAPAALPGTRADITLPAPEFPGEEAADAAAEAGEISDAASAAALALGWGVVRRGTKQRKSVLTSWEAFEDGLGR